MRTNPCTIVYIMYSRNKTVLACILIALAAEVSVMAVMLAITLPQLTYQPNCLISSSPGIFMAFWYVRYHTLSIIHLIPVGTKALVSRVRNLSLRPYPRQILSKCRSQLWETFHFIHLCPRRHMGLCTHFWYVLPPYIRPSPPNVSSSRHAAQYVDVQASKFTPRGHGLFVRICYLYSDIRLIRHILLPAGVSASCRSL